ncbi:MAG: hypothetical protein QXI77_00930 [Nanopusillaceae archaeon]|nr:hypothetical protein [Candidatus Aenigmarchaeota archaeon]
MAKDIKKEIINEIMYKESKYGYLPEEKEKKDEKHILDEIIEWLKSKRGGYLDKFLKSV